MDFHGPAGESFRLAEHYRQMTDGELIALAQHSSELTEMAQAALAQEVSSRKLEVPPVPVKEDVGRSWMPPPHDSENDWDDSSEGSEGSPYVEDRKLTLLRTVFSQRDALQLQSLLDAANIPFCMGLEKATRVDDVTSDFAGGVLVGVMKIGWPWASSAISAYEPKDEPKDEEDADLDDGQTIHCPKCHSTDVAFEHASEGPSRDDYFVEKFDWTCGACGHSWEDDGIVSSG